jgi:hypothetical protein
MCLLCGTDWVFISQKTYLQIRRCEDLNSYTVNQICTLDNETFLQYVTTVLLRTTMNMKLLRPRAPVVIL